jgi:hypothetical protein
MWPQVGYYHRQKSNTCTETLEEADRHDQSNAGKNCIIASLDELSKGSRPAGTDITGPDTPPTLGDLPNSKSQSLRTLAKPWRRKRAQRRVTAP